MKAFFSTLLVCLTLLLAADATPGQPKSPDASNKEKPSPAFGPDENAVRSKGEVKVIFKGVPKEAQKIYLDAVETSRMEWTVGAYENERAELTILWKKAESPRVTLSMEYREKAYRKTIAGKPERFRGARVLRTDYYLGALSVLVLMDRNVMENAPGREAFEKAELFLELVRPGWGLCRMRAAWGRTGLRPVYKLWFKKDGGPEVAVPTARRVFTKRNGHYVLGSARTSSGDPTPYLLVREFFSLDRRSPADRK